MSEEKSVENTSEIKNNLSSDIFITEENTFDIEVKFYKKDGKLFVMGVDDDFDNTEKNIQVLVITLKYPSQADCLNMDRVKLSLSKAEDIIDPRSISQLEYNRFIILARKWSLEEKLEELNILRLSPKIIKGILQILRDKISFDGII